MPWRHWSLLSDDSRKGALAAEEVGAFRSSVSRSYYRAYQAASAVLLCLGVTPPAERDAWTHAKTPDILYRELTTRGWLKPAEGQELKSRMEVLYKLRVAADYRATDPMSANDAVTAIRESDIIVKIIQEWLP